MEHTPHAAGNRIPAEQKPLRITYARQPAAATRKPQTHYARVTNGEQHCTVTCH